MQRKRRTKRHVLRLLILAAVIGVAGWATLYFAPEQALESIISSRVNLRMREALGEQAAIDRIDVHLHEITLEGIDLPLGGGNMLRIARAAIDVELLNLILQPGQWEQVVRSIVLTGAELTISAPDSGAQDLPDRLWLPRLVVPSALYAALIRFDSLTAVTLEDARIVLRREARSSLLLWNFNGGILQDNRGAFHIAAEGALLGDTALTASVAGRIDPHARSGRIVLECSLLPGSLPEELAVLPELTLAGGQISVTLTAHDTTATLRGRAAVPALTLQTRAGAVVIESLQATLERDTLHVDSCLVSWGDVQSVFDGSLVLRGAGPLAAHSRIAIHDVAQLQFIRNGGLPLRGSLACRLDVGGDLKTPHARVEIEHADLALLDQALRDMRLIADFSTAGIRLDRCTFSIGRGCADLGGNVILTQPPGLDLSGHFEFESQPVILGWASSLQDVQFTVNGPPARPRMETVFRSPRGILGRSTAISTDSGLVIDIQSAAGGNGRIRLQLKNGSVDVHAMHAQHAAALFAEDWDTIAGSVQDLEIRFTGHSGAGQMAVAAKLDTTAPDFWSRTMRNFRFSGTYLRHAPGAVDLHGTWSGQSARGTPFEGRADVAIADRVIAVEHFYIDAVGAITGRVDLGRGVIDVNADISELPIPELPLHPALIRNTGINGSISGYITVRDSLHRPHWVSSLSMIHGTVFGLPGYWMNLDVTGNGPEATVKRFDLGRGPRKILEAAGLVDVRLKQIAITAEIGAARAEEFVFALTGQQRYLSGEMDGRGAISGDLTHPDIEVELTVRDGELFDKIRFDHFSAALRSNVGRDGVRIVQAPRFAFGKLNTYAFNGTAAFAAVSGGALQASVTGTGDFLDLIDQVDRTFVSRGSSGALRVEVGGTIDRPELHDGELSVTNGRFSYIDATPDLVNAEVFLRWSPGILDTARIGFTTDGQWLQIRSLPVCKTPASALQPLIVPLPRICLGVLEIATGEAGIPLHLPGLMQADWTGMLACGAPGGRALTISGYEHNRLLFSGDLAIRNARVTYPFPGGGGGPNRPVAQWLLDRLYEGLWNLDVSVGPGNHYDVEVTGLKDSEMFTRLRTSPFFESLADYVDHLTIDAIIDPTDMPLRIRGVIEDNSFRLAGRLTSGRGRVEYLDQTFRVDNVVADFDETDVMPILEGRAVTMGIDSVGRQVPVYLTMYQIDRETGVRSRRGRFDRVHFILEGDAGQTPEQALAYLGYDANVLPQKAQRVAAATVVRMLGRQWLDPLERRLERWTWLDEVALKPGGGRTASLLRQQEYAVRDTLLQTSTIRFLSGSHVTVGKYISRDLFVTYTGELAEGQFAVGNRLGLVHLWNLEYRIKPLSTDLVLDFAVEYDEIQRRRDEAVLLKYSFPLELD